MLLRLGLLALVTIPTPLRAQKWAELQGRTHGGLDAVEQATRDLQNDALVLLVASHPDDRYVLPAIHLRRAYGARVAVLLASRGGGAQNSQGPETGDELERIRTLEAEAGCSRFAADVWYLDRPDRGFRRTAGETFSEWGREESVRELARLLRVVRPDVVLSTHHSEETHGHDLALAEILPEAVELAANPNALSQWPAHAVTSLFLGATSSPAAIAFTIPADAFEPRSGETWRRLAYDVLLKHHMSPGLPAPIDTIFEERMHFVAVPQGGRPPAHAVLEGVPTMFEAVGARFDAATAESIRTASAAVEQAPVAERMPLALDLARALAALDCERGSDAARRRDRRRAAALDLVRHLAGLQIEVVARPGAAAVPGEDLELDVHVRAGGTVAVEAVEVEADRGSVRLEVVGGETTGVAPGGSLHAIATYAVPLEEDADPDALAARFRRDRFVPPVRLHFVLRACGLDLPAVVDVPVELRPPVQLVVVPRMLLLPTSRNEVRFTVKAERHSAFPVQGELELRAPAGYRVEGTRTRVQLDDVRSDLFEFSLRATDARAQGVDRIRISLGANRVVLPVHKVAAEVDPRTRVGVVRSSDDALTSLIGAGGFGLHWAGLSDIDLAVGDLAEFDTVVVDVRALRDRPQARQSFRRLLEFATRKGHRLVVLYHKDTEYEPPGEGFRGAPFEPFEVGRSRVTRADAPVRVLLPDHVLLSRPNAIRAEDWDGWEQERALYLPSVYASEYEELLEIADPGLPVERSALLYARCGEGEFVYCSLSLWRQWKKLHPGSVRLLANLLTPALRTN